MGVRVFFGRFFCPKMPSSRPENGEEKSSPFLSFGFGVLFLLRRVFPEGFVQRAPCFVVAVFSLVLVVRF